MWAAGAVHDVYDPAQRAIALAEFVRVLRPGGRVLVQDFRHAREYQRAFAAAGLIELSRKLVNPLLMFPPTWLKAAPITPVGAGSNPSRKNAGCPRRG